MKTRHMSIFAVTDNDAGFVQAVISATDFPYFAAMGFVDAVNKLASEPAPIPPVELVAPVIPDPVSESVPEPVSESAPIATAPVPEPTRARKNREE